MTKKLLTAMLLLVVAITLFGQDKPPERLGNEAEKAGDDAYTAENFAEAQTQYSEAIKQYNAAVAADKNNRDEKIDAVKEKLFLAYYKGKKTNEAINVYLDLLKTNPNDEKKILIVAQLYDKGLKQTAKAIEHLKSFDAKKASFTLRKKIAVYYNQLENKQEALNWYIKAKELKQDPKVINNIAILYTDLEQIPQAIKEYEDYLKTSPSASSKFKTYKFMGALYEKIKQNQNAAKAYENALGVKYDSKIATKLMVMYFDLNNFGQAKSKIDRILKDDPSDSAAIYYRAQIQYKEGDKQSALANFKKIESDRTYGESAKGFVKSIESEM